MSSWKTNLCRRKYVELSEQFSQKVSELIRRCGYNKDDVDCCMKRLLKIAESREPTPHDIKMSAALKNVSKEHLERFFHIFCELMQSLEPREEEIIRQSGIIATTHDHHSPSPSRRSNVSVEELFGKDNTHNKEFSSASSIESVVVEDSSDVQEEEEEEQYEVERIISRTVTADNKYLYHVKWAGYETSSDAENFVEEKDMHCSELIEEFEELEKLKKKQREKRLKEQAELRRRRKLEAERIEKDVNAFFASRLSAEVDLIDKNSCEVIDMCSSSSSFDEDSCKARSSAQKKNRSGKHAETKNARRTSKAKRDKTLYRRQKTPCKGQLVNKDGEQTRSKKSNKKRKKPQKIIICSSSSEDEIDERLPSGGSKENHVHSERAVNSITSPSSSSARSEPDLKSHGTSHRRVFCEKVDDTGKDNTGCIAKDENKAERRDTNDEDDDPYGGFKYVRRESDGFRKGYKVRESKHFATRLAEECTLLSHLYNFMLKDAKVVKVSVVTEHPVNHRTVGVVVFAQQSGEEFAQYIPLKEIYQNAPTALRQYFLNVNTTDQKSLALSLILQKSSKLL